MKLTENIALDEAAADSKVSSQSMKSIQSLSGNTILDHADPLGVEPMVKIKS
ncbi:hypothetical protein [Pseudomonas sp.]|uniref:hypothetical protein n=1 Tax=Pseudomonas sp. TaxID=306 RepID=UPI003BAE6B12